MSTRHGRGFRQSPKIADLRPGDRAPIPPNAPPEKVVQSTWVVGDGIPLVSVLCPTFNHAPYIENALKGFLMQKTNFRFEILVHDDASNDGTGAIVRAYADRYPNIIHATIQDENQFSRGIRPFQIMLQQARGKYIAACEGDDYWLDSRKLQIQFDTLEKHPRVAICGHDALVAERGRLVATSKLTKSGRFSLSKRRLLQGGPILFLSVMFRNQLGPSPPEDARIINGDQFLYSRLASLGSYRFLRDLSPAVYNKHAGGIWSASSTEDQKFEHVRSFYWMISYYQRIGNHRAAAAIGNRVVLELFGRARLRVVFAILAGAFDALRRKLSRWG